ncbi:hypothetical protein ACLOJK_037920 [Asimina triloba]
MATGEALRQRHDAVRRTTMADRRRSMAGRKAGGGDSLQRCQRRQGGGPPRLISASRSRSNPQLPAIVIPSTPWQQIGILDLYKMKQRHRSFHNQSREFSPISKGGKRPSAMGEREARGPGGPKASQVGLWVRRAQWA